MKINKRRLLDRVPAHTSDLARESEFLEVIALIRNARQRTLQAVNASLVNLYWEVGRYMSQSSKRPYGVWV